MRTADNLDIGSFVHFFISEIFQSIYGRNKLIYYVTHFFVLGVLFLEMASFIRLRQPMDI